VTSSKHIFIRDCILNVFRRSPIDETSICSNIHEVWANQSAATKRKFSERDFLDALRDLVAVGTIERFNGHYLSIDANASEIVEPDFHAFAKAVTGCWIYGNGRFAVITDKNAELFPTRSAASSCAKEISSDGAAPGCIDLLHPGLGPGCDLDPLFFEKWERAELVRRNESNTVLLNIEGVRP
jgi:hypothetical protein